MANCKSIRLDFPSAVVGISNRDILALMQDCFIAAATSNTTVGRQAVAVLLARAAAEAEVNEYNDERGPSLKPIASDTMTWQEAERSTQLWLSSWVKPLVKELVPELRKK